MTTWELYAVKYAERDGRRPEHFYGGDPHDGPMPMDYFVWAAVSREQTVVIDLGFTAATAARRGRRYLRSPAEGLRLIDIDAATVGQVIVTHFHFDHVGSIADFPRATFVLQDAEMAFWTGRYASKSLFRGLVEVDDIVALVRENFAGRVHFANREELLFPGLTVYHVGGHAAGLQIVTVETARGLVVLAADATHYYANIAEDRPFWLLVDLPQMYEAFATVRRLAPTPDHIIPGHDPLVLERYPAARPGLEGIVARLA